jgi:hypothetical protein
VRRPACTGDRESQPASQPASERASEPDAVSTNTSSELRCLICSAGVAGAEALERPQHTAQRQPCQAHVMQNKSRATTHEGAAVAGGAKSAVDEAA